MVIAALMILIGAQFLEPQFIRGDCNCDGQVNAADSQCISEQIFGQGGTCCRDACDVDDSGCLRVTDIVYLNSYLFMGGQPPAGPWPSCGVDPVWDGNTHPFRCTEWMSGCFDCVRPSCPDGECDVLPTDHPGCWCDLGCSGSTFCPPSGTP